MTLQEIFMALVDLDSRIKSLLPDTGFDFDDGFGQMVSFHKHDPEGLFLKEELESAMRNLEQFHGQLGILRKSTHGEHTLAKFPNGRYGYKGPWGQNTELTCGHPLEALLKEPRYGCRCGVRTRIEHDGADYYLVNHRDVPLSDLTIRERW